MVLKHITMIWLKELVREIKAIYRLGNVWVDEF